MKRLLALVLGGLLLAGCRDANVAGPAPTPDFSRNLPAPGARGITVMTRNVYLGAELSPVIAATDFTGLILAATTAFATIQQTNFPERAQALADEIASARPHVIGLQEVERYDVVSVDDGTLVLTIDFLTILLDALAARGLDYTEAASNTGFSAGAPGFVSGFTGLVIIQLTDRDVILARRDVTTANGDGDDFEAKVVVSIPTPAGPVDLPIVRGWTAVTATVGGTTFRFVNTHLEGQGSAGVQGGQADELLNDVIGSQSPVILVGDFNSAADGSQTDTYDLISSSSFVDAWSAKHPRNPGWSCCQAENLLNAESQLDQRLDIVFLRGAFDVQAVHLVGNEPSDRTTSGLWPSDHAGVVATLTLPPQVARN